MRLFKTFFKRTVVVVICFLLVETITVELKAQNLNPIARLTMSKGTFSDECVFYFQAGGDTVWQSSYDAYKLIGPTTSAWLACLKGNVLTGISGLPALPINLDIKVKAISTTNATYTFSLAHENFPSNVCIQLFDTYTQQSANLSTSNYVCQLYDTTTNARFRIRFYTGHTNGNVALTAATCAKPLSAKIVATGLGTGPWNYDWYYQDSLVAQNFQVNAADSINNLALGHWKVKINPSGTCLFYTKSFTVSAINYSTAKFELNHAELNLSQAEDLILTNTSLQSQAYRWSFGDGSACSSEFEPKHPYSAAGDYVITLRTESSTGCLDSVSKSIKVNKDVYETTGISSLSTTDEVNLKQNAEGAYSVFINLKKVQALKIVVSTLDGRLLQAEVVQSSKSLEVPIIKGDMGIQMYLISVQGETMNGRFKIIQ